MSKVVIKVENISKLYRLGTIGSGTMVEDVSRLWSRIVGKQDSNLNDRNKRNGENLWAIKDVSFEVNQGEVLGVIGKNGAGKSTLLKILSQITQPTSGEIRIKGKIASLLEVGTGFHPELTGRENIFLNGAILGMRKKEIEKKFDEIVDFSGVEKFIDTPVKRYSSGMYVRLAFAVAAHLDPDILIVDEVLAVGDAEFQKKCLGKMKEVSGQGRTVIFVSHNMIALKSLCTKAILLNKGLIEYEGITDDAISFYLSTQKQRELSTIGSRTDRSGNGNLKFYDAWTENNKGVRQSTFVSGDTIRLVGFYKSNFEKTVPSLQVAFAISGSLGEQLSDLWSQSSEDIWENIPSEGKIICELPKLPLNEGLYSFNICARVNNMIEDMIINAASFNIDAGDFFGTGRLPSKTQGTFLFQQNWRYE